MAKQNIGDDYDLDTEKGRANAVIWLNNAMRSIKEGGIWLIPRSGSAYEVRMEQKVAVKLMATLPDPTLDKVFRAAGWKVIDNT